MPLPKRENVGKIMAVFSTINIVGSGMTAQQLRLDVISENITNMGTTRTEAGGAYRRKVTVMESQGNKDDFRVAFDRVLNSPKYQFNTRSVGYGNRRYATTAWQGLSNQGFEDAGGVRVTEIGEDESPLPFVYDPTHPDANAAGYVEMPNVTLVKEVTDAMAASNAFNADVTAYNTLKEVISSGLEIGG